MTEDAKLTNYDSIIKNYLYNAQDPKSWNNLYERPYMLAQIDSLTDKRVLDVGCGSGFYTKYALKNGAMVTAIDASIKIIEKLKKEIRSLNAQFFQADIAQPLSFLSSKYYDYIICSLVIHYIKDWQPLLSEFYRILKKKGKLLISTHHPFIDYLHLEKSSYFDKYLVEDIWGAKNHQYKVTHYTRSLTDILKPVIDSKFKIQKIEEPLPGVECKRMDPEKFKRLKEQPEFLFFVLQK